MAILNSMRWAAPPEQIMSGGINATDRLRLLRKDWFELVSLVK